MHPPAPARGVRDRLIDCTEEPALETTGPTIGDLPLAGGTPTSRAAVQTPRSRARNFMKRCRLADSGHRPAPFSIRRFDYSTASRFPSACCNEGLRLPERNCPVFKRRRQLTAHFSTGPDPTLTPKTSHMIAAGTGLRDKEPEKSVPRPRSQSLIKQPRPIQGRFEWGAT